MMKNKLSIISIVLSSLALIGIIYHVTLVKDKIAYIELVKVYNEFKLKKELEFKMQNVQQSRKNILDSLEFELKSLYRQINSNKKDKMEIFQEKRDAFLEKKKQFEEDNENLIKQYDSQIYTQLNQYVKEYGEENNYIYIIGANATGNIMYAAPSRNISDEIIEYINLKFQGKK